MEASACTTSVIEGGTSCLGSSACVSGTEEVAGTASLFASSADAGAVAGSGVFGFSSGTAIGGGIGSIVAEATAVDVSMDAFSSDGGTTAGGSTLEVTAVEVGASGLETC